MGDIVLTGAAVPVIAGMFSALCLALSALYRDQRTNHAMQLQREKDLSDWALKLIERLILVDGRKTEVAAQAIGTARDVLRPPS